MKNLMKNKMPPYTPLQREKIESDYLKKFGRLPPTPIGFSRALILDLMEKAVERGTPLKWEEYEKRFHYRKDVTY